MSPALIAALAQDRAVPSPVTLAPRFPLALAIRESKVHPIPLIQEAHNNGK